MTNKTEAPEQIWVEPNYNAFGDKSWPAGFNGLGVKYTRADLCDAQAARIAELEAERDETMREALSLARSLHKTHYSDVTQWEPLDYPAGIISQIDNMVAGIVARAEAAEAKLAKAKLDKAETVQHAASVILADRWGGYGNQRARQAMWDFVYKEHNRHMLPMSHYDGVLQAGLRALAELKD